MRKRLQRTWMLTASTVLATSFSFMNTPALAGEGDDPSHGIATTEEHGRTVYVNDDGPAKGHVAPTPQPKRSMLVYWLSLIHISEPTRPY